MARLEYITDDKADPEAKAVFDSAREAFNLVFNTYRILAYRPQILQAWHQLLAAILGPGKVDAQLKMLAFTTGSQVNQCLY